MAATLIPLPLISSEGGHTLCSLPLEEWSTVIIVKLTPLPEGRSGGGHGPSPAHFLMRGRVTMNMCPSLLEELRHANLVTLIRLPDGRN